MRLIDIYNLINNNIDFLDMNHLNLIESNAKKEIHIFSNQNIILNSLDKISNISILSADISDIKKITAIYNKHADIITCSHSQYNDFENKLDNIRGTCIYIRDILKDLISTQPPNTFSIKLPVTNSLSELANTMTTIEKLLNQLVVNEQMNGKVELSKVDSGSIWLDISLYSSSAICAVGSAAWAAAMIRKKWYEGNVLIEAAKKNKLHNDVLGRIRDGIAEQVDSIASSEFENALSQNNIDLNEIKSKNPEYLNRSLHVIKEFYKLFEKGMQIHSPLETSESVSNLFPGFKDLDKLKSKVEQIEGSKDTDN